MIKTITNCPTCGSEVTVEGDVTHYYKPVNKKDLLKTVKEKEKQISYLQADNFKKNEKIEFLTSLMWKIKNRNLIQRIFNT